MSLMKLFKRYILLLAAAGAVCSCNDWLDITPEDTTTEEKLFSDFSGYHSAINGLYQTLASPNLYGENLTWGFMSALSQYYDNKMSANDKKFSYTEQFAYNTDEVKAFTEAIWQTGYNVIANCNNVLQHLDKANPTIFPTYEKGEMDLIRGEALAMRGMMHFDLLRLFADAPIVSRTQKAIPYSTSYPDKFPTRYTTEEVLGKVTADLEEASQLLDKCDSIGMPFDLYLNELNFRFRLSNSGFGFFFTARGVRLNSVAVRSLLARVYAYSGDLKTAYEYAKAVDDAYVKQNTFFRYTPFARVDSEDSRSHKMIDELLACFYSNTLTTDYSESGAMNQVDKNPYAIKNLDHIFNDTDDYRLTKLIVNLDQTTKGSLKYHERTGNSVARDAENCLLPIMRLSEIHLLMAEYLLKNGQVAEAVKIVNTLRIARGCQARTIPESISPEELMEEINMEMWRENVAEGQYFFFCKRINAPTINNNGTHVPMEGKYTLPIPDSETSLN